jgi:hypothetical protein
MFFGIIVPDYYDISHIAEKVTIYLPSKKYTVCIVTEENVTDKIKEQITPAIIKSGLVEPVRAYQRYYSGIEEMQRPVINRKLMAFKSKLSYAVCENLASDDLYFKLENPMNDDATRRYFNYRLYYNEVPCYTFKSDILLDNFYAVTKQNFGPLIISTHALTIEGIPQWYTKETFRDMIELGEYKLKDKVMVEGPNTSDLYLFYQEETNVTEDMLNKIIKEIRGNITAALNLKIFPRNTPDEFIKNKKLTLISNKQYSIQYDIPNNINLFSETLQLCYDLKNLDELFLFLIWLMISPTWPFIELELKVIISSDNINIKYVTKYLPDYIRVNSAKRVQNLNETEEVEIIYPDRNPESEKMTNTISFYDYGNNERALLIHSNFNLPKLNKNTPSNYSLDSRIEYDINPI